MINLSLALVLFYKQKEIYCSLKFFSKNKGKSVPSLRFSLQFQRTLSLAHAFAINKENSAFI